MGCSNPAWCRANNTVLQGVPEVYKGVDDCIVQAQSEATLVPKLREFFEAARQGNMKFSKKKLHFGEEVEFGGYPICGNSRSPVQGPLLRKVKIFQDYPEPQNEPKMKIFLG